MFTDILPPYSAWPESADAQESPQPPQPPEPLPAQPQALPAKEPPLQAAPSPASQYSKAIFLNPIPGVDLALTKQFAGAPAKDLMRDSQFRKLITRDVIPNCMFHYDHDLPLSNAMDWVIRGSPTRCDAAFA